MPLTVEPARAGLLALAAVGAAGAAAAIWGIGIERHLYALRQMSVPALPEGSSPLRILHLADAHMAPWQRRKQRWMASLAELAPDLVVNTGDNLGHPGGLAGVRAALAPFAGVPGVFVYGSNDKYAPKVRNPFSYLRSPSQDDTETALDTLALTRFLGEELGWADINNSSTRMTVAGHTLEIFGVDDAHRGWDDLDRVSALVRRKGWRTRATTRIGVTHAPYQRVLNRFTDLGAEAIFAGHTHGGQVCLPGFGALVANCDIPLRQAKGLSTWEHDGRRVPLNVSAGIGHSIYAPVRFACRPEATLLTLTARS